MNRTRIRSVDAGSALQLGFVMGAVIGGVFAVGLLALWVLGLASGATAAVETGFQKVGFDGFQLGLLPVLGVGVITTGALSVVLAALSWASAQIFNAVSAVTGGIGVHLDD